jgi:ribosomal-protein-alanine N-acetyltransferase
MEIRSFSFDPFPVLQTERLILRSITYADTQCIFDIRSDKDLMRFIPRPMAKNMNDAKEVIRVMIDFIEAKEGVNWAITRKDSNDLIGTIGIYQFNSEDSKCELGYMLRKDFHNKGLMTEAISEVLNYSFRVLGFNTVEAVIDPANEPSEKVLLKTGFKKDSHFIESEYDGGKLIQMSVYAINQNTFNALFE